MSIEEEIHQTQPLRSVGESLILNVVKTADLLKGNMDVVLKPYELSQTQFNILRICKGSRGKGITCSEISDRLVTKVPDVTRLLDRMEKKGLVYRKRCTADRRVIWIFISEKGEDVVVKASEKINKNVDAVTLLLENEVVLSAITVLEKLRNNINNKETG
ncbi:MAG: MarR family transcriptional regulator [Fibrobacterales bacterium]